MDEERIVDVGTGNEFPDYVPSSNQPVPTTLITFPDGTSEAKLVETLKRISVWCPPGTKIKDAPIPMNSLGIETDALSAGSTVVKLEGNEVAQKAIQLVQIADGFRLTPHQYFVKDDLVYVGLKRHPRHEKLDKLGPRFDAGREIRRLQAVEFARNSFLGYKKAPKGERETELARIDEWRVYVKKPGFKNADDFFVLLEAPSGDKESIFVDQSPDFRAIFREAMWNIHCPNSGLDWMKALWHLWNADVDPLSFIPRIHSELPPCSFQDELRYPRGPFLWLLNLVFIEEDVNYRFFYHKRGPWVYRKQGRDMPMNGILTVAANPLSSDLPRLIAENARGEGQLIGRPQRFEGPPHLREWFESHVLEEGQSTIV